MIDTHAHIYASEFEGESKAIVDAALLAGVTKILMPNIDRHSIDPMLSLASAYPGICYPMMGLHPCYVKDDYQEQLSIISKAFSEHTFLAVGEIGTDLYWDKSHWDQQVEAFHYQCELALRHDLPIVIHCRESIDETIAMVASCSGRGLKGVFHCFTGSVDQAMQIAEEGFYLGLGGVSTFKNGGMDQVIPHLPKDRIVLETDAPYLAPAPMRGKRNEPAFLSHICRKVAEYLRLTTDEVTALTTANANRLFFSKTTAK